MPYYSHTDIIEEMEILKVASSGRINGIQIYTAQNLNKLNVDF